MSASLLNHQSALPPRISIKQWGLKRMLVTHLPSCLNNSRPSAIHPYLMGVQSLLYQDSHKLCQGAMLVEPGPLKLCYSQPYQMS